MDKNNGGSDDDSDSGPQVRSKSPIGGKSQISSRPGPSKNQKKEVPEVAKSESNKKRTPLKILGISEMEGESLIFKVMLGTEVRWVKRSFLIPDYLLEMVEFYESNINFIK